MFEKYSKDSESNKIRMTFRFAYASVPHIIASYFGSGVLRPASGTWGTFAGLLTYMLFEGLFSTEVWIVLIVLSFFIGAWASEVTGRDIQVHDHSSIVIDEVFAIWLVLITVPQTLLWYILSFLAFRLFDIIKIQPAKYFDTSPKYRNGYGVMLDDLVAAVQSIFLLQIILYFVK